INETANVILVRLPDFGAYGKVAIWIVIITANEIGRETAVIVDVGFAVGHSDRVPELAELWTATGGDECLEIARQQLVLGWLIIRWRGMRKAVSWNLGVAQTEIVSLHGAVA